LSRRGTRARAAGLHVSTLALRQAEWPEDLIALAQCGITSLRTPQAVSFHFRQPRHWWTSRSDRAALALLAQAAGSRGSLHFSIDAGALAAERSPPSGEIECILCAAAELRDAGEIEIVTMRQTASLSNARAA
jgi:hypothetical protein